MYTLIKRVGEEDVMGLGETPDPYTCTAGDMKLAVGLSVGGTAIVIIGLALYFMQKRDARRLNAEDKRKEEQEEKRTGKAAQGNR